SRLALAESRRSALESALATAERHVLAESYQKAQDALTRSQQQARGENDEIELLLAGARLCLVPVVGNPQFAASILERVGSMSLTPPQRYQARLDGMIVQAQLGRYVEAE